MTRQIDGWVKERLTGLNPTSIRPQQVHAGRPAVATTRWWSPDRPISARRRPTDNDENMIVVSGNKRVADIYLGEFMRLYSHHAFTGVRRAAGRQLSTASPRHLSLDDSWRTYFGDHVAGQAASTFRRRQPLIAAGPRPSDDVVAARGRLRSRLDTQAAWGAVDRAVSDVDGSRRASTRSRSGRDPSPHR